MGIIVIVARSLAGHGPSSEGKRLERRLAFLLVAEPRQGGWPSRHHSLLGD